MLTSQPTHLLLVLPLPIYRYDSEFFLDRQACNGLRLWLQNFDRVTMCNPVFEMAPPDGTQSLRQLLGTGRLEVSPLPAAYTAVRFVTRFPSVRRTLHRLIDQATHLQFAIGGLFGDWGAVATLLAAARRRRAAVWTDRVESAVLKFRAEGTSQPRRVVRQAYAWLTRHYERYVIGRAAVGLFHGMDTFAAYSPYTVNPQLVHDIHLGPEARITSTQLREKCSSTAGSLRIVYAGRLHPDKGFADWVEVLSKAEAAGLDFSATWYGDGPGIAEAKDLTEKAGIEYRVRFPGPVLDHNMLLDALRRAHIFLFCHKTPESPRCLIEALLSGTPIVGYDSAYARDLIRTHDGGVLSPVHDTTSLARELMDLSENRAKLTSLIRRAADDGYPFTDVEVFRHRSTLIKEVTDCRQHLPA